MAATLLIQGRLSRNRCVFWLLWITVWILFSSDVSLCSKVSGQLCNGTPCVHGTCENSTYSGTESRCECLPGWRGHACDSCGGRAVLSEDEGYVSDGDANYTLYTKCSWLIAGKPNSPVHLRLDKFATECGWDHLYVYDGDSIFSPLIAAFSGLMLNDTLPEIHTSSGSVFLHFYSDAAYNMSGFNIYYKRQACPLGCTDHGTCQPDGTCVCDDDYRGDACDIPKCPGGCNNGTCKKLSVERDMRCHCEQRYRGADCSIPDTKGAWEHVVYSDNGIVPMGRASHKSVIARDSMWVVAGYSFNRKPFENLLKYDFSLDKWEEIVPKGRSLPAPRYGHSLSLHKDHTLYMYGGLVENEISNELWLFNISAKEWIPIDLALIKHSHPLSTYLRVAGHSSHIIGDKLYVIFGHSPVYGYLNTVQECDLNTYVWQVVETQGAMVKGGYGHSSVYDPDTKLIYVHGGYHSGSSVSYYLSDYLYSYDPANQKWTYLSRSGNYKYLHSAVISSGLMLVFGGNTHNDTSSSKGAKCYSAAFMAYDIKCDRWHYLDEPHLQQDISRYGHIAEMYQDKMYTFGGFNGLMLNDMYVYTPASCNSFESKSECTLSHEGVKCAWVDEQGCMSLSAAKTRLIKKTISLFSDNSDQCDDMDKPELLCPFLKTCPSCVSSSHGCVWCNNKCEQPDTTCEQRAEDVHQCSVNFTSDSQPCIMQHNCYACQLLDTCTWDSHQSQCDPVSTTAAGVGAGNSPIGGGGSDTGEEDGRASDKGSDISDTGAGAGSSLTTTSLSSAGKCEPACTTYTSCENCTSIRCMWCANQQRCVESNSYSASFPYGQCMEWTTAKSKCASLKCENLRTCSECQENGACGWCDDGSNTGLGTCMEGSATAPNAPNRCPAGLVNNRWYFVNCPSCQCNGHSSCLYGSSQCTACQNLTTGRHCEHCMDGYYGDAINGGACQACNCSGRSDTCHPETGTCFCRTKGVIGEMCDSCDESKSYYGDPKAGGTCFYDLKTDYLFTFNLSKRADIYYTSINFMNTPPSPDKNVDFTINCTGKAYMKITVKTKNEPERTLTEEMECTHFADKFKHDDFGYGKEHNTTFYIYVFNFTTPFSLTISFSQTGQLDLVNFFVTFFSCFLSLLIVAAVLYKVKHRYDLYRRHQRMEVEMEQMASRPFSSCTIEVPYPPDLVSTLTRRRTNTSTGSKRKHNKTDTKPAKQTVSGGKCRPIALEPLVGGRAAILSLAVKLPTGDEDWTPRGQAGISIASTLIALGSTHSTRKGSVDYIKADKHKARKNLPSGENCI